MHATICDMITDLVQNAFEAHATEIKLNVEEQNQQLKIRIEDNGKGMSATILEKAKDPFYTEVGKHRHRNVGLGLPFLFQTAEMASGNATVKSTEGVGTTVEFKADLKNVDLPAFGNFATAAGTLMSYPFDGNLIIERTVDGKSYSVEKNELVEVLGELDDAEGLLLLREFFETNEEELAKSPILPFQLTGIS